MKEAVKAINGSADGENRKDKNIFKKMDQCGLQGMASVQVLSGVENRFHSNLAHVTPGPIKLIFKFVLEHFRAVSDSTRNMVLPSNIALTVVRTVHICSEAKYCFAVFITVV